MPSSNKEKQREYDKARAASRNRNWVLVCYPEDLPKDWLEQLKAVTPGFCSPLHDQDKNDDGTDKKAHCHVVLCFTSKQSFTQVVTMLKDLFGEQGESIVGVATPKVCRSVTGSVRYMAHADNPEKAQYDREGILAWGGKSVDKVWGDDEGLIRGYLVEIEEICEDRDIIEISELSRELRMDERWDLYDVLTRRCTNYLNAFLSSRRHKEEKPRRKHTHSRENGLPRFSDCVPKVDPETGEVIEELAPVGSSDSTLAGPQPGRAALDATVDDAAP